MSKLIHAFIKIDFIIGNILGGGGGGGGGEVELFGGEASPAPPSLDETLGGIPRIIAGNGLLDFVPL